MEASTIPQRPPKVKLAVNLLYLGLVIGAISGFLQPSPPQVDLGPFTTLVIALLICGVLFWWYYMIGKGRNWARMAFLVIWVIIALFGMVIFFALFFTETPLRLLDTLPPSSITDTILQFFYTGLDIAALILLFQRDSSDWFKAMKALRKPQEVPKRMSRELEPGEALIAAARKGDMKQIQDLLGKGADVNAQNKWGLTPLMAAAHGGYIVPEKLLLEKGADVNATQHGGWTALMVAAVKGHVDVVNLLLGKGADVNAMTESRMTALMLASSNGRSQVVQLLKAHEAKE
jgi:uncharacterized protein